MSPFIPIEIIEKILGLCEIGTIPSCSLDCKSWNSICRPRLFERLRIRADHHGICLLGNNGTQSISDRESRPLQYTKEIFFTFRKHDSFTVTIDQLQSLISLVNALKSKVDNRLRQIIVYSDLLDVFSGSGNLDPPLDLPHSISCSFPQISELKIRVRDENLRHLLFFACSFPTLRVLVLECNSLNLRPREPLCVSTLPKTLKIFRFDVFFPPEEVLDYYTTWLASHPPREISHLHLSDWSLAHADSYALICKTTLTAIQFRFGPYSLDGTCDTPLYDLSPFLALKTITFIENYNPKGAKLIQVRDAWARLDETLATSRFSQTIVEIRLKLDVNSGLDRGGIPQSEEEVRRLLKTCSEKGRLVFTSCV
ncbi:hypothetical protein L218DRAFT_1079296 [Marasmius fiardii PR-910]|nr:hypothetical protein L218DRAFT_1079296 [Marasmius fiardii PR-910]